MNAQTVLSLVFAAAMFIWPVRPLADGPVPPERQSVLATGSTQAVIASGDSASTLTLWLAARNYTGAGARIKLTAFPISTSFLDNIMFSVGNASQMVINGTQVRLDADTRLQTGKAFYFGETSSNGSWRVVQQGNNLVFEYRENGTWIAKQTLSP